MIYRKLIVLSVALAIASLWQPLCAQPTPQQTQISRPAPYRVIQAVSGNMAQQKIAEAAADGYRVISIVPVNSFQPTPVLPGEAEDTGGSGLTIVLHHSALKQTFEYRLLVFKETSDLKKALNQYGAEGFRLIPSSVLMAWAEHRGMDIILDPEAYSNNQKHRFELPVVLMEKASADTVKYSYQVSKPGEIQKLGARGYYPVAGDVFWNFVILESQTPTRAPSFKIQRSRLAKFNARSSARPEITRDTADPSPTKPVAAKDGEELAPELDVKLDESVLAGKKLLLLNDGLAGMVFAPTVDVVTESDALDTPTSYRLLLRNNVDALEKAVNESAAQGFRLFPTIATAYRKNTRLHGTRALGVIPTLDLQTTFELQRVMAVMYPGSAGSKCSYRIVSAHSPADLLKILNSAEADGFRFVSLWRGTLVLESERHAGASQ